MVDVSVVIPTLNEVGNIDSLLSRILKSRSSSTFNLEVIVVDDGSNDGTCDRVQHWESIYPVRLFTRDVERGLAGAILAGAEVAKSDIIVVMDADLSHPPETIPQLVEPIINRTYNMVIGSRYVSGGSTPGWSVFRRICSRVATCLAKPLTDVHDPMSGFFAIRRELLSGLCKDVAGFKIGLELLVNGESSLQVAEVPIEFHDRQKGKSKLDRHVILDYLRQLVNLAGGNISATMKMRFAAVGFMGVLVDLLVFNFFLSNGSAACAAHVMSFFVATLFNFILNTRWSFVSSNGAIFHSTLRRYLAFLTVALLALFMRGGILALLIDLWNWPDQGALLVAIGAAALINYIGCTFFIFPRKECKLESSVEWRVLAIGVVGYILVLRLVYLGLPELLQEEAYYWNYAQHLDIGYLDHPPMVGWIIWLSTALLGSTEFAVRIGAFVCWMITFFFTFGLARNLFDRSTAFRAVILLSILPVFFGVGFVMTPDAPLVACWAGALYFLERVLIDERSSAWWGAGICIGLGMLSKYTIVLLWPAVLLFLLMDRRSRRWFFSPRFYLAAAAALLLFSPVIFWNANHEWASFIFQGSRRLYASFHFSLGKLIAHLLLLLTPTGVMSVFFIIISKRKSNTKYDLIRDTARKYRFGRVFTILPLSVFLIFSIAKNVKLNWTGPLWLMMVPFVACHMLPNINLQTRRFFAFIQRFWPSTIVTAMLIYGMILYYVVLGIPGLPYPENSSFWGWEDMALQIEQIENALEFRTGTEPLVVGLDKYKIASELAFYRTKTERNPGEQRNEGVLFTTGRHLFGENSLMYSYWLPKYKQGKGTMILVSKKQSDFLKPSITSRIHKMGEVQVMIIKKRNVPVGRCYFCFAEGCAA